MVWLSPSSGVINEGIPAVVLFNQKRTDAHQTLMAGELEELPKLLRRVYKATKGKYLSTDSEVCLPDAAPSTIDFERAPEDPSQNNLARCSPNSA